MFHVGQKVVCVDAEGTNTHGIQELYEGRVYTVLRVASSTTSYPPAPTRLQGSAYHVWLAELETRPAITNSDCPFASGRFRPVVERKTDISALKALLNTVPEKVLT